MIRQVGMESIKTGKGQNPGGLVKRIEKQAHGTTTLVDLNIQDKLARKDRK